MNKLLYILIGIAFAGGGGAIPVFAATAWPQTGLNQIENGAGISASTIKNAFLYLKEAVDRNAMVGLSANSLNSLSDAAVTTDRSLFLGSGTARGTYNTAVGHHALIGTTGGSNTALGRRALQGNTSGTQNTASGYYALWKNTTGSQNTALGFQAGDNLISGNYNIAIGFDTDFKSTTGSRQLNIGNIIHGINSSDDKTGTGKIGVDQYCDENLQNCISAANLGGGSQTSHAHPYAPTSHNHSYASTSHSHSYARTYHTHTPSHTHGRTQAIYKCPNIAGCSTSSSCGGGLSNSSSCSYTSQTSGRGQDCTVRRTANCPYVFTVLIR